MATSPTQARTDGNPPDNLDHNDNKTDRAIRALREYQGGKATTAFVRQALRELSPDSLLMVSLATRVPSGTIDKIRSGA